LFQGTEDQEPDLSGQLFDHRFEGGLRSFSQALFRMHASQLLQTRLRDVRDTGKNNVNR